MDESGEGRIPNILSSASKIASREEQIRHAPTEGYGVNIYRQPLLFYRELPIIDSMAEDPEKPGTFTVMADILPHPPRRSRTRTLDHTREKRYRQEDLAEVTVQIQSLNDASGKLHGPEIDTLAKRISKTLYYSNIAQIEEADQVESRISDLKPDEMMYFRLPALIHFADYFSIKHPKEWERFIASEPHDTDGKPADLYSTVMQFQISHPEIVQEYVKSITGMSSDQYLGYRDIDAHAWYLQHSDIQNEFYQPGTTDWEMKLRCEQLTLEHTDVANQAKNGKTFNIREYVRRQIENDCKDEAVHDVNKWLKNLNRRKVPAKRVTLSLNTDSGPLTIDFNRIGETKNNNYNQLEMALLILQEIMRIKKRLGVSMPSRRLQVFDLIDFDIVHENSPRLYDLSNRFTHAQGLAYHDKEVIILSPQAFLEQTPESHIIQKINAVEAFKTIDHESTHYLDPYLSGATDPQCEGFATMAAMQFNFDFAIDNLRNTKGYTSQITRQQIIDLYSATPEGVSETETYALSGTFMAYAWHELGSENFMNFYGLLTGGLGYIKGPAKNSPYEILQIKNNSHVLTDTHSNLQKTLEVILQENPDLNPENFIQWYLYHINRPNASIDDFIP